MTDKDANGQNTSTTRRTIILGAATAAAALPLMTERALAAGTVPQKTAQYQDHPKGAAKCGGCNYYLPGKDPKGPGACKQVAGAISPNGWCIFYAAKHA